jgi:hypothetical protein
MSSVGVVASNFAGRRSLGGISLPFVDIGEMNVYLVIVQVSKRVMQFSTIKETMNVQTVQRC